MRLPVLAWPWLIALIAFVAAFAATLHLGLTGNSILYVYVEVSFWTGLLALLAWMVAPFIRAVDYRRLGPISAGAKMLRERWMSVALCFVAFPIFMTAFTTLKIAFPFYSGYTWDGFFTYVEAAMFGTDPWRYTHAIFGMAAGKVLTFVYAITWAFSLAFAVPLLCFNAAPERAARAMSALMLSWLVAGVILAAAFSSAGPVFAHLVDPDWGPYYEPLLAALQANLPTDSMVLSTQKYLGQTFLQPALFKGGGISAMPSMHVAVALWIVFVAPRGPLRWLAWTQFALIWIGSVHFGYHYALDGALGSLVAWGAWRICVGKVRTSPTR